MTKKQLHYFEEKAKSLGLKLFVESNGGISLDNKNFKLEEATQGNKLLIESSEGKKYEAQAVLRNVPVSRYTENKNGRVYNKKLWEKVLKEKTAERTLCLEDHPSGDDSGSVGKIVGVWHNMRLGEQHVFADLYLVEDKPIKVLKAGGSLGTSSVGYGEMMEDGSTVNPESFYLERLSDLVLDPSQSTYMTYENMEDDIDMEDEDEQFNESTNTNIKSNDKKDKIEVLQEKRGNDNMDEKTLQLVYKNQVKGFLKECSERKDYKALLTELEEARRDIPESLVDVKAKFEEMTCSVRTKIDEELKQKDSKIKESEDHIMSMTDKYDVMVKQLEEMSERYKKAEKLIESFKKDSGEQIFEGTSNSEAMKTLIENQATLESDRAKLVEDIEKMDEDIKVLTEQVSQLKYAEKHIKILESLLIKKGYKFSEEGEDGDEKKDEKEEDEDKEDEMKEADGDAEDKKEDEKEDEEEMKEDFDEFGNDLGDPYAFDDEDEDETFMNDFGQDDMVYEAEEDDEEAEDEDSEEDKKEDEKEKIAEAKKKDKKKPIQEAVKKPMSLVYEYYKEAVIDFPKIKQIRTEVLTCKSLVKAIELVESFKGRDVSSKPFKMIKESTSNVLGISDSDIKPYKFPRTR